MDFTQALPYLAGFLGAIGTIYAGWVSHSSNKMRSASEALQSANDHVDRLTQRLQHLVEEQDRKIDRLERIETHLRGLAFRLIAELSKHDSEAAEQYAKQMHIPQIHLPPSGSIDP